MDLHDKLDDLTEMVENARAMPLSASCVVNRAEVLQLLDEIRELLPEELAHAEELLSDRDALVADGRAEADRVLAEAREEQTRLVSETQVVRVAHETAGRMIEEARSEAEQMRAETDTYVDGKLANFEIALNKTLDTVHRGRERIHGRDAHEEFGTITEHYREDPLPHH